MNKIKFFISLLMLSGLAGVVYLSFSGRTSQNQICVKGACFRIEIAITPEGRAQGLMYRNSLAQDAGMLFVFRQEGAYPFWMKNTKIPLDMIWIDKDKKVIFVAKNVQPCGGDSCPDIIPDGNAMYVLEINAGLADKFGIKQGDAVSLKR